MTRNRVIGRDGRLPWNLPDEMAYFRRTTLGKPIVMGRKTFDSHAGKPFPRRTNIVLSRQEQVHHHVRWVNGLDEGIAAARETHANECFVIGGEAIYKVALPIADRLYETVIDADLPGDTYFPTYDETAWTVLSEVRHKSDKRHVYPFRIRLLVRKA